MHWQSAILLCNALLALTTAKDQERQRSGPICKIAASKKGIATQLNQAGLDCKDGGHIVVSAGDSVIDDAIVLSGLKNVEITLLGTLHLRPDPLFWHTHAYQGLLAFQNVTAAIVIKDSTNITITGGSTINPTGSTINGNGQLWWKLYAEDKTVRRPALLTLLRCTNAEVSNLRIASPPFWATYVSTSRFVKMYNYMVQVVGDDKYKASNTDGVNIRESNFVDVHESYIFNTDDCVAIKGMTSDVYVHNVTCGKLTAGISVGSLGNMPGIDEYARNVLVEDINVVGQSRGVFRIKQWPSVPSHMKEVTAGGGMSTVKNIVARRLHGENSSSALVITQCYSVEKENSDCYGAPSLGTLQDIKINGLYSAVVHADNKVGAGFVSCANRKNCWGIQIDHLVLYAIDTNRLVALPSNNIGQSNISAPADIPRWDKPLNNGCYLPRLSAGTEHEEDGLFAAPLPRDRPAGYTFGVPPTIAGCSAPGFVPPEKGLKKDFQLSNTTYQTPVFPMVDLAEIPKTRVVVPAAFPKSWLENSDLPFALFGDKLPTTTKINPAILKPDTTEDDMEPAQTGKTKSGSASRLGGSSLRVLNISLLVCLFLEMVCF